MARSASLQEVEPKIGVVQRLQAMTMAGKWCQLDTPPTEADKIGVYAAALSGAPDPSLTPLLARCLVWAQSEARQFCATYHPHYVAAFQAFPNDERIVFFLATLCYQKSIAERATVADVYSALLRPERLPSPLWATFGLNKRGIVTDLANLYATDTTDPKRFASERISVVEAAYNRSTVREPDRLTLAKYLGRAYRAANRLDADALEVLQFLFQHLPDDRATNRYLAEELYATRRVDDLACSAFARLITEYEADGDMQAAGQWTVRLAHVYITQNRFDEGTVYTMREAAQVAPDDMDIVAALAYATAQHEASIADADLLAELEQAMRREEELSPIFVRHGWEWNGLIHALASGWVRMRRVDRAARAIFVRAMVLFPDENLFCLGLAHALIAVQQYNEDSILVYQRARSFDPEDAGVLVALGRTYLNINAVGRGYQSEAISVWEDLYREGKGWSELVRALGEAYLYSAGASDTAISIWAQIARDDPRNGSVRFRLGRAWRERGDYETALRWLREAHTLLPQDFDTLFALATLVREQGRDTEAATLLTQAVETPAGRDSVEAQYALADVLIAQGRTLEATVTLEYILNALDKDHVPTLLHLTRLGLQGTGESIEKAALLAEQTIRLAPYNAEGYSQLAQAYRKTGRTSDELAALQKYAELGGNDASQYRYLADLALANEDYVRAETALRRMVALGSDDDKELYSLLGEVMMKARAQR